MKKALSLLIAITLAACLHVAVFADSDLLETEDRRSAANSFATPSTRIGFAGTNDDVVVAKGELFLVDAADKVVGGVYNMLDPDSEYTFRIYHNNTGADIRLPQSSLDTIITPDKELTGKALADGTVRLRTVVGSTGVQSARIKTVGRGDDARYDLIIETRNNYGTKITEVEYTLHVTGSKAPAGTFVESAHMFEVGYQTISDAETDVGEDGYILIDNERPVITKEQFSDIAKSANYKTVTLEAEDGSWTYTGRVSGMGDTNFYYSDDVIPDLVNMFPEQEYKFLTFHSGVAFPATGEMRIDVSEFYDTVDDNLYAYLYRNGKLTQINSTQDTGADEIVFRTNYLGSFVITDKRITDTTIVSDLDNDKDADDDGDVNSEGPGSGNPDTGAGNGMNIAITLGVLSLMAAGIALRKKP